MSKGLQLHVVDTAACRKKANLEDQDRRYLPYGKSLTLPLPLKTQVTCLLHPVSPSSSSSSSLRTRGLHFPPSRPRGSRQIQLTCLPDAPSPVYVDGRYHNLKQGSKHSSFDRPASCGSLSAAFPPEPRCSAHPLPWHVGLLFRIHSTLTSVTDSRLTTDTMADSNLYYNITGEIRATSSTLTVRKVART